MKRFFAFALLLSVLAVPSSMVAQAEQIRLNFQHGTPENGDFTLGPTRYVLSMAPGDERTVEIQVTNRTGVDATFRVSSEDFAADSEMEGTPSFFSADLEGPYPARLWLDPEATRFATKHGERAFLNVTVRVPEDAEPGDHQAAIIIEREVPSDAPSGIAIVSRVATLFIITVDGPQVRDGRLDWLRSQRYLNWLLPIAMQLHAVNPGTVHLAPTGTLDIKNLFGIAVDEVPLRNWYVLRDSSRTKDLEWAPRFALGRYTASTNLVAYDGQPLPVLSTAFWVIPIIPVIIALAAIFLVSFVVQIFFSRFEIRRKK
jgi:hypothetical protein